MGQGLLGCLFFSLGLIPTAVHSASNFLKAVSVLIGLVPLIILYQPATVSSFCDDLLDQLNDVSFLGDQQHKDRCTHLRHSWTNLNRAQGLGFKVFGVSDSQAQRVLSPSASDLRCFPAQTVVDKRKLVNIGTKMGVGLGSVMGTLVAMGNADLNASANATDVVG